MRNPKPSNPYRPAQAISSTTIIYRLVTLITVLRSNSGDLPQRVLFGSLATYANPGNKSESEKALK